MGVVLRQASVKVNDSINGISYYLSKHSIDDNFSFRKTALCVQHSPIAAAPLS